ncbi:hypothetical protein ABPG74_015405 [Tetrahymena malaccensis]
MNSKFLIALSLVSIISIGAIAVYSFRGDLEMGRNQTTVFQWYSCFSKNTQAQCDDLKDDSEKNLCFGAAHAIGDYTYDGSPLAIEPCQQFHNFLKQANTTDVLNTGNYYQNCYMNVTILKAAYQSYYFNNTIYYPQYIRCAGF